VSGIYLCGNSSMKFKSNTSTAYFGAYQVIDIANLLSNQNYDLFTTLFCYNPSTPIESDLCGITWEIEGFSKSDNVSTSLSYNSSNRLSPYDYSIYVDYSVDRLSARSIIAALECSSGTTNWERHITYFTTPISGYLYVYILFRQRTGTAWFDSIRLSYKIPDGDLVANRGLEYGNLVANGGFEYDINLGFDGPTPTYIHAPALGWNLVNVTATNGFIYNYSIADITQGTQYAHSQL